MIINSSTLTQTIYHENHLLTADGYAPRGPGIAGHADVL